MTIMDTINLVAEATQVPLADLTLVGTRRYGPDAPVHFVEDKSDVTGTSDVDVVVPWDGDMIEMRSRIEAAFPEVSNHPNRGLVPYEGAVGWTPSELNLVVEHEGITINMIVKPSLSCAVWRAIADELDWLSRTEGKRTALWADKPTRVAAFKAARSAYLQGYARAQGEASASYWALHARAIAAENSVAKLEGELEHARLDAEAASYEAHQRQLALEAQLRVRGILMVTFLVAFAFMVWYVNQI